MVTSGTPSVFDTDSCKPGPESVEAQFTEENICGEGAACVVYQLRVDGLRVAVKRLLPELRLNPTYVAAYRKEYVVGRRLRHDALPVYRSFRCDSDEVYIVMDFVDGVTLEEFLKTEEGEAYFKDGENIRRFFTQLLDAVTYLHRSGVVHCDLKPSNILLRHSDRAVMVIDLDKAYCDTLDLTHGGTPGISDVTEGDGKPTASKDFMAIGRILDLFGENVRNFPKSRFRRFRKECSNKNATSQRLYNCLQSVGHRWLWIALAVAVIISVVAVIAYHSNSSADQQIGDSFESEVPLPPEDTQIIEEPEIPDNSFNQQQKQKQDNYPEKTLRMPTEEESRKNVSQNLLNIDCDIDEEMKGVIQEMEEALVILETNPTDDRKREISSAISRSFITSYNRLLEKCESRYPEIDKEEISQEMTRRMDYSNASRLYQRVKAACRENRN